MSEAVTCLDACSLSVSAATGESTATCVKNVGVRNTFIHPARYLLVMVKHHELTTAATSAQSTTESLTPSYVPTQVGRFALGKISMVVFCLLKWSKAARCSSSHSIQSYIEFQRVALGFTGFRSGVLAASWLARSCCAKYVDLDTIVTNFLILVHTIATAAHVRGEVSTEVRWYSQQQNSCNRSTQILSSATAPHLAL